MKELSLNILDITGNSIKAGAKNIQILIDEKDDTFLLKIIDDGCGMTAETVDKVTNPFYTTRTTRKVGLGVPFLILAAEQTGGYVKINSRYEREYPEDHGTEVEALFYRNHIDFEPLGDIVSTVQTLIQGSPDIEFYFHHNFDGKTVELDTKQLREILGNVPLNSLEVIQWIGDYLKEAYCQS